MSFVVGIYLAALVLCQTSAESAAPRPHPLAPSIPLLSQAEYDRFDRIIEQFILYDTGKLTGAEGEKALADFKQLGPEAIFSLIDGLNRAANMPASCPAVIIGKKIAQILSSTSDVALLDYARENIGSEVTVRRHLGTIRDLKLGVMLRRNAVVAAGRSLAAAPLGELAGILEREHGDKMRAALLELDRRGGAAAVRVFVQALPKANAQVKQSVQSLLLRQLALASTNPRQRRLVAAELINLLDDKDEQARQVARDALVRLSGGQDFGPSPGADDSERSLAVQDWRGWLERQAEQ